MIDSAGRVAAFRPIPQRAEERKKTAQSSIAAAELNVDT
jgi:hypothetical protein